MEGAMLFLRIYNIVIFMYSSTKTRKEIYSSVHLPIPYRQVISLQIRAGNLITQTHPLYFQFLPKNCSRVL